MSKILRQFRDPVYSKIKKHGVFSKILLLLFVIKTYLYTVTYINLAIEKRLK